jgi:hypothetical protein
MDAYEGPVNWSRMAQKAFEDFLASQNRNKAEGDKGSEFSEFMTRYRLNSNPLLAALLLDMKESIEELVYRVIRD